MNREFYFDLFQIELERREQLTQAISLPVGVLSLLGGLLGLAIKDFTWSGGFVQSAFVVLIGIAAASFIATVVFLALSFWGHAYHYLATPTEMREYHNGLTEHAYKEKHERPTECANEQFEEWVLERLIAITSHNTKLNDLRSERLFRANGFLLCTLFFSGLSMVSYLIASS